MKITDVSYTVAVPAKKIDIVLWLLTGGKFGKVFVPNTVMMRKYHAIPDPCTRTINCRCVVSELPRRHGKTQAGDQ